MKKLVTIAVSSLTLFGFMTPVWAACSLPRGIYLEYNYGASRAYSKSYPGVPIVDNTGMGWNGTLGYKFMPYVALEGGYTRYASTRLENSEDTTAAYDHHYAVDVAVKGIFPILNSGVEIFGKLGVDRIVSQIGNVDASSSAVDGLTFDTNAHSAMGWYGGAGLDYSFVKNLNLNLQYAVANGSSKTGNMNLISLGLEFILDPAVYC